MGGVTFARGEVRSGPVTVITLNTTPSSSPASLPPNPNPSNLPHSSTLPPPPSRDAGELGHGRTEGDLTTVAGLGITVGPRMQSYGTPPSAAATVRSSSVPPAITSNVSSSTLQSKKVMKLHTVRLLVTSELTYCYFCINGFFCILSY